jgi:hypothetical protein
MTTKKELEAKIAGLEFIIQHMRSDLDRSMKAIEKLKEDRVLTDFESGMRYQAEMLKDHFAVSIECGEKLSQELLANSASSAD